MSVRYRHTPESYVLRACLDFLSASHIWAIRINTGSLPVFGPNGSSRHVNFGVKGMADILSMPCLNLGKLGAALPVPLWVECKAPGQSQTQYQISFQQWVEGNGHFYIVAYDPDDIRNWIENKRRLS